MLSLVLAAVLKVVFAAGTTVDVGVTFQTLLSDQTLGLFHNDWSVKELRLLGTIQPKPKEGNETTHTEMVSKPRMATGHAFMIMSSDHHFRVKVGVKANNDRNNETFPFLMNFKNVMMEGTAMEVEGQDGTRHFAEAGEEVGQYTSADHLFQVRDHKDKPFFNIWMSQIERGDL
eukprot:gnl/TRDRNA2_/TRDRNA2_41289_c0_seq1.p1 gnl/TRDRNA2_/TRDRNA2_41289_c0~~gnl/TRDRNA2_/TRDRNA2_41289_c0_seq1.p1  ORF type:complete len:174 (+),score=17.71 gnl/TRDRNA2_/TRDRNA2_41289_c0_seq1:38-559(+)